MKTSELVSLILGAAGLWKLLEVLIKWPLERFRHKAESRHLHAQTDTQIVENWVKWSAKLEERINELEAEAELMRDTIVTQNRLIEALRDKVDALIEVNTALHQQLQKAHAS